MNNLQDKLIIKIISYFGPVDLLSLSLTSKLFSQIINEHCDKLTASFDSYTRKCDWIGSRKYKNVEISALGVEKFLEIGEQLTENGKDFVEIEKNFTEIQVEKLQNDEALEMLEEISEEEHKSGGKSEVFPKIEDDEEIENVKKVGKIVRFLNFLKIFKQKRDNLELTLQQNEINSEEYVENLIQSQPEILETFGDHVKTLRIRKCEITSENMLKVLNLCRNLKNFYIEVSKLKNWSEIYQNLPTLKLEKLSISQDEENEIQVLKIFKKSEVKELSISIYTQTKPADLYELLKFLQSQDFLETFKINIEKFEFPIIVEDINFKLKNLSITKSLNDHSENAESFLMLFQSSLESLEFNDFGYEIAGVLVNFPKLTKLCLNLEQKMTKIDFYVMPSADIQKSRSFPLNLFKKTDPQFRNVVKFYNSLPQVEFLKITSICCNLFPYFPNLKTLIVEQNVCNVNFEYLTELEFLDVKICQRCGQIKIPKNLKKLKISTENSENVSQDSPPFGFDETVLEELTLDGFVNLSWLGSFLDDDNVKLKMLRIKGSKIKENLENVLKNYEQKIGKIVIC